MPELGIRSTYSQCPFQIQIWDDHGIISSGSAFFYELDEDSFLITNWHNVSGRHFLTDKVLSPNGRTPTYLKAMFATVVATDGRFTTAARSGQLWTGPWIPEGRRSLGP